MNDDKETKIKLPTKKIILFVEDDKFFTGLLAKRLMASDYDVLHANTGAEAVKILESKTPDLMVFDIILPEMDGLELLRQVKLNPQTKGIPVIILSNLGSKEQLEKAQAFGAKKFLIKATVSVDQVLEQINTIIDK